MQLDPVLVAELDRLEKATVPVGPPASSDAPTAPLNPVKASGNRITGTLSISSSPRSSHRAQKTPGPAGMSVALDPSLVQEAQKPSSESAGGSSGKEHAASEVGTPAKQPSQPMAAEAEGRAGARISGAFNAVESDFFAREADLYKRDGDDNFSDLDEPAGRVGAKNAPRRNNRR